MAGRQVPPLLRFIRSIGPTVREPEVTDSQLLAQFLRQRDETAFRVLFRRHGPMVWSVCRRALGNTDAAEDAFQATFLVFLRKAQSIGRPELLANYLYGIACRTVVGARRLRARQRVRETQQSVEAAVEAADEAEGRDLRPLLDEELQRLPEKYRVPLVLCYLQGKTYGEAARLLALPEGTVSGRLARARELLRHRLVRRGFVLSAGTLASLLSEAAPAAAIPGALEHATIQACQGTISPQVAALSKGLLHTMILTKLKIAGTMLLTVALTGTGAGFTAQRVLIEHRPDQAKEGILSAIPSPEPATNTPAALAQDQKDEDKKDESEKKDENKKDKSPSATSPDRKVIARGKDKQIGLFDSDSGKEIRRLIGHTDEVTALAFTPDGKNLASGARDKTVMLWDVPTGKTLWKFTANDAITSIEPSKDGRTLMIREGAKTKRNLDVATGKAVRGF